MNGITREFLAEQWKRSAAEEEEPLLISSPKHRSPKQEEARLVLWSFFKEIGLRPGDRLLVKRGDETKELNLDAFLDAQP